MHRKDRRLEEPQPAAADQRLESWKEIAAYLRRDISTVQRWEKKEGLPVLRHLHEKLGTVYAYKSALDDWCKNRQPRLEEQRRHARRRKRLWTAGVICAILLVPVALAAAIWGYRRPASDIVARRVWSGPDVDRLGTPSAGGILFSFSHPATGDVAVRNLETGEQRLLTEKQPRQRWEHAVSSAISPDGRQVAYTWFNEQLFSELRLVSTGGSAPRVLFGDPEIWMMGVHGWSGDGRQILTLLSRRDYTNEIAIIGAADGSVRIRKKLGFRFPVSMSFSPDSRYILYDLQVQDFEEERDLFLLPVDAAAGDEIQVKHPANDYVLGWPPDGRSVVFASDRAGTVDAWALPVSEGKPRGLPVLVRKDIGRVWPLGFTRTGDFYYGLRIGMSEVYLGELDSSAGGFTSTPAALPRTAGANRAPDWSPDGNYLAYMSAKAPGARWPGARLVIRDLANARERYLWPKLMHVDLLQWAAHDKSLWVSGSDERVHPGLFRVALQTGATVPVSRRADPRAYFHELAGTPDGRRIFFKLRDWHAEPSPLIMRDLASGTERVFLPSVYRFALSPDGKQLAYSNPVAPHQQGLFVLPSSGGPAAEICRTQGQVTSIVWTRDARWLLFSRRDELWRVAARGGPAQKVATLFDNLRELRLHPDGRRFAFTAGTDRGEVWVMNNLVHLKTP